MTITLTLIIVYAIILFAVMLVTIGAILWYLRKQGSKKRPVGKDEKRGDEITETEAEEITATWNLLNPP